MCGDANLQRIRQDLPAEAFGVVDAEGTIASASQRGVKLVGQGAYTI